jgi:ATP-binding cassette subfamily C protein CydD
MNPDTSAETPALPADWLQAQRPYSGRWVTISIGLAMGNGLLLILQAWLLARSVDAVVFHAAGLQQVDHWLWMILGLFSLRALLNWLAEQAAFRAAIQVKLHIREQLLQHLLSLGPVYLGGERTGELTTSISDGVEALEAYFARYLPAMSLMALLPLTILAVVFPLDWIAGLILLLTAPLIPLFMILIGRGAERLNQRQWRKLARLSAHFLDVIQGLTTLKLFNASRREITNVARISDEYRHSTMAVLRVAFLSSLALEFFATVSIAVVAVSIGFRLLWGDMDFVYGFFILLLAPEFYLPLRNMGTHYHARMEAIGAAERLQHILDIPAPASQHASAPPPDIAQADIRLEHVSVVYPNGTRALDGIDLSIAPGERLAIVGPSGSGKSTLANLLLGFVVPSAGEVRVGELSLLDIDPEAWRRQLAWVPQRPHLFAASVAENIRMARPAASDVEVVLAACDAQAEGFIDQLPDGYATRIGDGGTGLSGGQAQRIALARALLRDAPMLLLDEPTANLDRDSERLVQTALQQLPAGRTVIVIAHRLNTVRSADRILLLQDGRITAQGSHAQLLRDSAAYRDLVADFGETA